MNKDLEITLAEEAKKFPAWFHKQYKEYHKKHVHKNCWVKVAFTV